MKTDHNIIVSSDGPFDNVLKLKPPMCFNKENCDLFVAKLGELLKELREKTFAPKYNWTTNDSDVSWQGPRALQMKSSLWTAWWQ